MEINKKFEEIENRVLNVEKKTDEIMGFIKNKSLKDSGKLNTCEKCSHKWICRSKHQLVTCPSCLGKTKNL